MSSNDVKSLVDDYFRNSIVCFTDLCQGKIIKRKISALQVQNINNKADLLIIIEHLMKTNNLSFFDLGDGRYLFLSSEVFLCTSSRRRHLRYFNISVIRDVALKLAQEFCYKPYENLMQWVLKEVEEI